MHIPVRPVFTAALALLATAACALAGPLDPPAGPITSTQKPLAEIEPRTPISLSTTPGDANSLFRISQPGSYYLTGNVTGVAARRGIEIAVGGVTIDLNGFELAGVAGSLDGIAMDLSVRGVHVHNGTVRNWSGDGVRLENAQSSSARDLRALDNGGDGISLAEGSVATGCIASGNTLIGIVVDNGSAAIACSARLNGLRGFSILSGSSATACAADANSGDGIATGSGCTVTGCSVYENAGHGINAVSGCTVSNNSARLNGLDGIRVQNACIVVNNSCSSNGQDAVGGAGIHLIGVDTRVEGNNCCSQDRGIRVDTSGNYLVRNTCSGNTDNWDIAANNIYGPIINRVGAATAGVLGNAGASTLGSTDANANYSY